MQNLKFLQTAREAVVGSHRTRSGKSILDHVGLAEFRKSIRLEISEHRILVTVACGDRILERKSAFRSIRFFGGGLRERGIAKLHNLIPCADPKIIAGAFQELLCLQTAVFLCGGKAVLFNDGPIFKRIALQRTLKTSLGPGRARCPQRAVGGLRTSRPTKHPKEYPLHRPKFRFILSKCESIVDAGERFLIIAAQCCNTGNLNIRLLLVGESPRTAPEQIFCTLKVAECAFNKSQIVLRCGVKRTGVVLRCAGYSLFEVGLRFGIGTVLRKAHTHCEIRLGIVGVDLKRTPVVRHRIEDSVVELVKTEPHMVGEFGGCVFFGLFRIFDFRRKLHILGFHFRHGSVDEEYLAGLVRDCRRKLLILCIGIDLDRLAPGGIGIYLDVLLGEHDLAVLGERDRAAVQHTR